MFALIRHAGYHLGDGTLTPDGEQDILRLAEALASHGPWKEIRYSPSTRTQETAAILSKKLDLPAIVDQRIGMDGDLSDLLPPTEPNGLIFVTHLPILSRWLRAWAKVLGCEEPPLTEIASGYLLDGEARSMVPVGPLPRS